MLSAKSKGTKAIIQFLKQNYQNYEENIVQMLDTANNGFYFINENKVYFSNLASKMLNVEDEVNLSDFLAKIYSQDREIFCTVDSTYELTYRYNLSHDKTVWIKEHGLFDFKNKNQRLAIISKFNNQTDSEIVLQRLAYYDGVTNLKNRNYFEKDAAFLVQYKIPFALFFIDLNSFKLINDNFGHSLGDSVLRRFADKLKTSVNYHHNYDIYRISGDEFYILLPYLEDKMVTKTIVNGIIETFNQELIVEDYQILISPSIGIAFYPTDSDNLETIIKYADLSMYRAKMIDHERYSFFDQNYYLQVLEEESIEEHIKYLIDHQLINLYYQPIFDICSNRVVSFEALFNSQSKYNPDKIFTTALKSPLIMSLDKYIIELAIKNIRDHEELLTDSIRFTINVTPKTFYYEDVYTYIKGLLEKYNVEGKRLGIELTEQYFLNDEEKLNTNITKLQSLGIHIYLDDFGMGYSSIRNLMFLSYDHLKLDRRMISTLFTNHKSAVFIKNMVNFSHEINSKIIFEGVETEEQLDYIKKIGGKLVQGFYYSKAIPIKEALKLLKL